MSDAGAGGVRASDRVWCDPNLAAGFLEGVRGAVPLAAEQVEILLRLVRGGVGRVERFLDLGCGDGLLGRALLGGHPDATGVFLDFSEPMLAAARERLGSAASRHHWLLQDYGDRKWIEGAGRLGPFDVIVSGYSIHHQEDSRKREIYAEILGLLRAGGLFLNLEHVASASTWGEGLFDEHFIDALAAHHAARGDPRTRDRLAATYYHRPDKAANRLAPVETQCDWLRALGYERVDCFFKVFELALFGGLKPGGS
jgi:SAM-dependent methyltransferase